MRIRAERDDLADVLTRAGRAVGSRSPLPILQGLLCEVENGRLRVTGTDNEITVRTNLEVEALEDGSTVIPAKLAADAVRKLPSGAVSMTAADGEVEITGNGPRFRLRELSVGDFPTIDDRLPAETIDVVGETLVKALSQVGIAASSDEARPTLTGVLFEENEGGLRLVATDSYRLAVRDVLGIGATGTKLVPYRALREIGRTVGDGPMKVALGDREAAFVTDFHAAFDQDLLALSHILGYSFSLFAKDCYREKGHLIFARVHRQAKGCVGHIPRLGSLLLRVNGGVPDQD